MKIIIAKNSGFCAGVKHTIDEAKKILKNNHKVYSLGEIVHNEEVVKELEKLGMITVNSIEEIPDNSKVIFRAHGEALKVYEIAKNKNLEVYDLTCGKIKLIHKQIMEVKDTFVIIIAKKTHPETIGTMGHTDDAFIVEDISDIDNCYKEYLKSNKKNVYLLSQTTFSSDKFDELVKIIKEKFDDANIIVNKSICNATANRQKEVVELAKKVDIMLIVGGINSSNTKELYNLAVKYAKVAYQIQNEHDLPLTIDKDKVVGIMAGASTNNTTVSRIVEKLNN